MDRISLVYFWKWYYYEYWIGFGNICNDIKTQNLNILNIILQYEMVTVLLIPFIKFAYNSMAVIGNSCFLLVDI
jgi:hypothetical protein